MTTTYADKIDMQNRLFAELSAMFGREVPLYDRSLAVNQACNRTVCDLLGALHPGFEISDDLIDKTSGERHGAIRIGKPSEYRWVGRFFGAFAMEPHNFYDMSNVGAKSQPIIATAFRSRVSPEHRVFTSLLQTDYFDPATRKRIEDLLVAREVFSPRAKELIERGEKQGGLAWNDAEELIREGSQRIFKWTGQARDYGLYKDLCDAGFKIAADIACFESHHLNHLTPNTFCMDLYTAAMKFCMGELPEAAFRARAETAMGRLRTAADKDFMRLCFRHLTRDRIDAFGVGAVSDEALRALVNALTAKLLTPEFRFANLKHAGFKDFTEGPSQDTPVLLRQDAYKALTEPVKFRNPDGSVVDASHTARFGEIEQRFYATTAAVRELYDRCLSQADAEKDKDPGLIKRDFAAYEATYAAPFAPFPKTLRGLLEKGLVYGVYSATPRGVASRGSMTTTDLNELIASGFARVEGLRYEDFLPVSAAGIFASNLNQYGTKSTAAARPTYTQAMLEEILGRPIVDAEAAYHGMQARSILETYEALGLTSRVPQARLQELRLRASAAPKTIAAS